MFGNAVLVDYQPTCENLVADFAERIAPHLPPELNYIVLNSTKLRIPMQNGLPAIMNSHNKM